MFIDRRDLRWRARDAMRAACPNAMLMTLMYLLLTDGLSLLVSLLVTDPLDEILHLYMQGLNLERAIPLAVAGVGSVGLFLSILLSVFGVVVSFGYKGWCLNAARGEQGAVSDLIGGFSMVGRILWLCIRIAVYCLFCYLAIVLPALFCTMLLCFLLGPAWGGAIGFFGTIGVFLFVVLRYAMAPYCLLDEPEMGAGWALRRSRRMMEGHVKDYFLLRLSFIGWYLLNMLAVTAVERAIIAVVGGPQLLMGWDMEAIAQISSSTTVAVVLALAAWPLKLWLLPYVTMTECKFYEQIKIGPSDRPPF